jgi:hypothetical protein
VGVITHRVPLEGFAVKFLPLQASLAHENQRRRDAATQFRHISNGPIRDSQLNVTGMVRRLGA